MDAALSSQLFKACVHTLSEDTCFYQEAKGCVPGSEVTRRLFTSYMDEGMWKPLNEAETNPSHTGLKAAEKGLKKKKTRIFNLLGLKKAGKDSKVTQINPRCGTIILLKVEGVFKLFL